MENTRTSPAHTPGPWQVAGESTSDGEAFIIESADRTIGWTASGLSDEGFDDVTPEDEANSRLFAAAPDMHDALLVAQNALKGKLRYETPDSAEHTELQWVLDTISAALPKAA